MTLAPGDLLFVGWDSDNDDIAFVTTADIAGGEVIFFTDDEWNGTAFNGGEQYMQWTVPDGGIEAGTVITIDMDRGTREATIDAGGDFDYMRGGYDIAQGNEMFWAFQGDRDGNFATPTNFIAVIGNESNGNPNQSPNLENTGLTPSNGALIIDGDEDYMEYTADAGLPTPVERDDLIASILNPSNWTTADGGGVNNPNPGGVGFDVVIPDVVCFTAGTLIRTPDGEVLIETLVPGDLVDTLDHGPQPLRWIGIRAVAASGEFAPVRFAPGAIGNPEALDVSPWHRMLVTGWRAKALFDQDEVLVPAKALVNDTTITRVQGGVVRYVHILFDAHQIVFVGGVPSESFNPTARALDNMDASVRDEVLALFPLLSQTGAAGFPPVRPVIGPREARLLV